MTTTFHKVTLIAISLDELPQNGIYTHDMAFAAYLREEYADDEYEIAEEDGEELFEEDDFQEVQDNSWLYENC